jgi:hypothetical protein
VHIKVEDSSSGESTDGDQKGRGGEEEEATRRTSLVLAPLLESLPELSLGMTTAPAGDPPFSVLLRLLDLPDLLQAEAGAYSTRPLSST